LFRVCFRQLPSYAPTHKAQMQRAGKRHCGRAAGALAAVAHEFVADGSIVVALDEYSGTYKPTGKGFSVPFAHMWKLQDGKATSLPVREYRGSSASAASPGARPSYVSLPVRKTDLHRCDVGRTIWFHIEFRLCLEQLRRVGS
jgi:hypothetical protein